MQKANAGLMEVVLSMNDQNGSNLEANLPARNSALIMQTRPKVNQLTSRVILQWN
jgi:hypothetical protein